MLATAGRIGAILELTWDRVDFERGKIDLRLDATGPRKGRAVLPMNNTLRAVLQTAKDAAMTDFVVEWAGGPIKDIKKGFARAVRSAGLGDVSPHVLRHTAGVHMISNGVDMALVSQFLGHSSIAVTQRVYARYAPDHMRDAAEVLSFGTFQRLRKVQ